jgi:hypothetical protein
MWIVCGLRDSAQTQSVQHCSRFVGLTFSMAFGARRRQTRKLLLDARHGVVAVSVLFMTPRSRHS